MRPKVVPPMNRRIETGRQQKSADMPEKTYPRKKTQAVSPYVGITQIRLMGQGTQPTLSPLSASSPVIPAIIAQECTFFKRKPGK